MPTTPLIDRKNQRSRLGDPTPPLPPLLVVEIFLKSRDLSGRSIKEPRRSKVLVPAVAAVEAVAADNRVPDN